MFDIFSKKPLSELSLDELKRQEQSSRRLYRGSVIVCLGVLVLVSFWIGLRGYHSSSLMLLVGFSSIPAITADRLKKIRAEISARG